jgi:hypothetical protein
MLFRDRKGKLIEINRLDFNSDEEYYKQILKIKELTFLPKESGNYIDTIIPLIKGSH